MNKISIVSWNIQGKKNISGFTPFSKVKPYLEKVLADIFVLQEVVDAEKIFKDLEELKDYNIFIPKRNKISEIESPGCNNNVILSKYPISNSYELSFPNYLNDKNIENCSVVDIEFIENTLRIYNCHFRIGGAGVTTRLKQLEYVVADSKNHEGPIVICGDLNTTIPKGFLSRKIVSAWHKEPASDMLVDGQHFSGEEKELFYQKFKEFGFREVGDPYNPTWSPIKSKVWEMFNLKLDWFAVKNIKAAEGKSGPYISDHKPFNVKVTI